MGLFSKGPHREKCRVCKAMMDKREERLYAMPRVMVGHYRQQTRGAWYRENLVPIASTSQLPAGIYCARLELWQCPSCHQEKAVIRPFLPVRDAEMRELPVTLEYLELDALLGR